MNVSRAEKLRWLLKVQEQVGRNISIIFTPAPELAYESSAAAIAATRAARVIGPAGELEVEIDEPAAQVQVHGVHADELRPQQAKIVQPLQGPYLVGFQALMDLVVGFVDVHVDGKKCQTKENGNQSFHGGPHCATGPYSARTSTSRWAFRGPVPVALIW